MGILNLDTLFYLFIGFPILMIGLFWLVNRMLMLHSVSVCGMVLMFFTYIFLAAGVVQKGSMIFDLRFSFFLDSLSILMLGIVIFITLIVSIYSVGYLNVEFDGKTAKENERTDNSSSDTLKRLKVYYSLMYLFVWTMIITLSTSNMGIMWVAIEATTLSSAFLVGFYGKKSSIEAAWKYVIICSVGIAIAMLGIVFLHIASVGLVAGTGKELNWSYIMQNAGSLDIAPIRLSFIFILIGFGTKAGLAPMHTWLPDAHSQAPAPISAMLSGVLLNTAMYGIMREVAIVNKAMGSSAFTGKILMFVGMFSIFVAAVSLIRQKDYKRLLAYSSIEHMGIISLGLGVFTPLSIFAILFHTINHSITKAMLFLASGNVFLKYHTREISKVRGMLRILPITGTAFLLGIFAITGMPPFGIFSSKLSLVIATIKAGNKWYAAFLVFLLAVVFLGFAVSMLKMFYNDSKSDMPKVKENNFVGALAILILLVFAGILGFYMPRDLLNILNMAQKVISGG